MTVAESLKWLEATGLEGPTHEQVLVGGARLAEVVVLGLQSMPELGEQAEAAMSFFFERIRTLYTRPAIATASMEGLEELWSTVSMRVLRLMDSITVTLYEASGSELTRNRLAQGDRHALMHLDRYLEGETDDLMRSLSLMEHAREYLRLFSDEAEQAGRLLDGDLLLSFKAVHQGELRWNLGVLLCVEIAESRSELTQLSSVQVMPHVTRWAAGDMKHGSILAALYVAEMRGLKLLDEHWWETEGANHQYLNDYGVVDFLLRATEEIRSAFGVGVRFALGPFVEPEDPDSFELHLVIETNAESERAIAQLDQLCETWWDDAATGLNVDIVPVLGVIDG
ncbi:MAG: hypothetical protein KC431_19340 [Myxococcales bacterium]|nr:hypothetical protein [Myxococcales bacterium]